MPTLGKYVEAMDDENNLLYPKTAAAQVIYSANKLLPEKIIEVENSIKEVDQKVVAVKKEVDDAKDDNNQIYPTLKGRLDAMDTRTKTNTDEIEDARNRKGTIHQNLKARLDAMDTDFETTKNEIEQARGGENSLGDRLTTIVNGNQTTLDEVIKARDGETDLDARLDKMQAAITTTSNQVTQAMTDDLGVKHPTLQVRLDTMRKDAKRTDEEVVEARTSAKLPNAPYATLKARLDAMDVETDGIKTEISDARGAGNSTLNERLDKMQDQIDIAGGGNPQEVIDAREDVDGQIHQDLKTRLDSDYNKLDNKFGNYLPLTGGTVTGNVGINADLFIGGLKAMGNPNTTTLDIGSQTNQTNICSRDIPQYFDGADNFLFYTHKNKPTAVDVGALPITGGTVTGDLNVNGATNLSTLTVSNYSQPIEIGKYIDLHDVGSNNDVDVRIEADGRNGIKVQGGADLSKSIVLGIGTNDKYVHNSNSNKFLQLKDNGQLQYDSREIPTLKMANGYLGLCDSTGGDNMWVRTPQTGLLPYSSTVRSDLGSSTWFFGNQYVYNITTENIKQNDQSFGECAIMLQGNGDTTEYGKNNMFSKTWHSWGIVSSQTGLTNILIDARTGRVKGKSGYLQAATYLLQNDSKVITSKEVPAAFNVTKGQDVDTDVTVEDVVDFLEKIQPKTLVYDVNGNGAKQRSFDVNNGENLQLGFDATDLVNHKMFKYIGEVDGDEIPHVSMLPMIMTVITAYKHEKAKRELLEERLNIIEKHLGI